MLETVSASLIVAAVTGLTIVAYKHPSAYRKIGKFLLWVVNIVFGVGTVWDTAVGLSYALLSRFIIPEQRAQAEAALNLINIRWWLFALIIVAINLYLFFLLLLPVLFEQEYRDKRTQKDAKDNGKEN